MTEHNPATLVMIAVAVALIPAVAVIVAALIMPVTLVVPVTLATSRVPAPLLVAALIAASLLILIGPLILRARARGDAGSENQARCYDRQFLHRFSLARISSRSDGYSSAMSGFLNEETMIAVVSVQGRLPASEPCRS